MTMAVPEPGGSPSFDGPRRLRKLPRGGPTDLHLTWRLLAGSAPDAAAALIDVAKNGPVAGARVAAAKAILEMTGFRAADSLPVLPPEHDLAGPATVGDSPAARIRSRLDALAAPRQESSLAPTLDDLTPPGPDDVIDAEVVEVEPDPDQ